MTEPVDPLALLRVIHQRAAFRRWRIEVLVAAGCDIARRLRSC